MTTLSKSTTLKITVGTVLLLLLFAAKLGWNAQGYLRDQAEAAKETNRQLKAINEQLATYRAESWKINDMERWAEALRWQNRDIPLDVPSLRKDG